MSKKVIIDHFKIALFKARKGGKKLEMERYIRMINIVNSLDAAADNILKYIQLTDISTSNNYAPKEDTERQLLVNLRNQILTHLIAIRKVFGIKSDSI